MKNFGFKIDFGCKLFFVCKIVLENDLKLCNYDILK